MFGRRLVQAPADPVVERLHALAAASPDLGTACAIYEVLLPILRDADLHVGPVLMRVEQAQGLMAEGEPLLAGLELDYDVSEAGRLMIRLASALEDIGPRRSSSGYRLPWSSSTTDGGASPGKIRRALESNLLDVHTLLMHVAVGNTDYVSAIAGHLDLDPELLLALSRNALKPALRAWCRQLSPLAEAGHWTRGTCMICGANATLAELQDNDQVKHLRCGSCGADWRSKRLQCAHCGCEDHKMLRVLFEGKADDRTRVEACDACKGYLKVRSAFSPSPPEMLVIDDLETMRLDFIARRHGYAHPGCRSSVLV